MWVSEVLGIYSDCSVCFFLSLHSLLLLELFFFFDVGMMGVTSRCLASRDNLIFKKIINNMGTS